MKNKKELTAKDLLKENDIVFPYVWGDREGNITVDPIVVFWHKEMKCFYTTVRRLVENDLIGSVKTLSPSISLVGWVNPIWSFGTGLKVFIPSLKLDNPTVQKFTLGENQAIEIEKVLTKSAIGHLVEISAKRNEKG